MSADMLMVRNAIDGGYNLAVGEPFFLQKVYGPLYPSSVVTEPTYPLLGGNTDLVTYLRKLFQDRYVVITNGAKQGLLAGIHALQSQHKFTQLYVPTPFWPSYPTLAGLSGLQSVLVHRGEHNVLQIHTSPNNPDGEILAVDTWNLPHIWDAAYASPVYGFDPESQGLLLDAEMSVFSAAKLFGMSGSRLGWIVTDDASLADRAAQYVEKTTSGVSSLSQSHFLGFLKNLHSSRSQIDLVNEARAALDLTADAFMGMDVYLNEIHGYPISGQGMFAWVSAKDPEKFWALLEKANVKAVSGEYCGATSDWIRFSLGVNSETMTEAVQALKRADNG